MIEETEQFREMQELAHLPPTHRSRLALEQKLAQLDESQRHRVQALLRETDELHQMLCDVTIPLNLSSMLLSIPGRAPVSRWHRLLHQPVGWKHIAAVLLLAVSVFAAQQWLDRPAMPPPPQVLDAKTGERIASLAVQGITQAKAPEIVTSDRDLLQTQLNSRGLGFEVSVPSAPANLTLVGGGVRDMAGTPAAYSQWKGADGAYTLYQFDAQRLGVPSNAMPVEQPVSAAAPDANHYRVAIRPAGDGRSAWAVVMMNQQSDPFQDSCR